jgi:hypothetical protein
MTDKITQERLKELFHYDSDTGIFTRIKSNNNKAKVGDIVSCRERYGYIVVRIDRVLYRAHRLAWLYMTGNFPEKHIDHINHVRDDNRWSNLREATYEINNKNVSMLKNNTSGICGVGWDSSRRKWKAQIGVNGGTVNLGHHADINAAILTRKAAEFAYGFHPNHGRNLWTKQS